MKFEYDPLKSQSNKLKHGIDFEEAQALWSDGGLIEAPSRNTTEEPRFMVIGRIEAVFWPAIVAYRNDAVRIISVRCSRKEEVRYYEQKNHLQ